MSSNLLNIKNFGQAVWIDNLSRNLINSGNLKQLIDIDGIVGVTSNPTIFHKAISNDISYQNDLVSLKNSLLSLEERYEVLVIPDIQKACDLLANIYHTSKYVDGYVSFEVAPHLAHNVRLTIENAKRLWNTVNRPNLMIKIPATPAGLEAFEELTSEGINVNITLIFSLNQLVNVWTSYINGLSRRVHSGKPIDNIKAVASFFISRIDTAIDKELPQHLQGKTAISLSKVAYAKYNDIFGGEKFNNLKPAGAMPQFLLFASTGTKNPQYSDVLYIEELIGKNTINTVPDATLAAFRDHGIARNSLIEDIETAQATLQEINNIVDLNKLGEQLQIDGLILFEDSFNSLLELMK
ncbi:MAG: transaldolase [Burkholderiales bacterium]|nr:transaldolase [Burkholderiales bacterium]